MKIKQLEEMITSLHKGVARTGDHSSTTHRQPPSDQNIPSQVSSPPVPDRDGPVKSCFRYHHARLSSNLSTEQLLQGTPAANRASEVGRLANRTLRTPTRTIYPQEPEHTALPRRTAMKPKGKGLMRSTTEATDEIIGSDDEFDEPVINALGKRDRFSKKTGGKKDKDSSGEEAERPHKNRVSRVSLSSYSDRPDF